MGLGGLGSAVKRQVVGTPTTAYETGTGPGRVGSATGSHHRTRLLPSAPLRWTFCAILESTDVHIEHVAGGSESAPAVPIITYHTSQDNGKDNIFGSRRHDHIPPAHPRLWDAP